MTTLRKQKFFFISLGFHFILLFILLMGFDFSHPIALEHTDKQDILNAVILGDSPQSKILPEKEKQTILQNEKDKIKVITKEQAEKTIALERKKKEENLAKKQLKILANDLLKDIKTHANKQKQKQNNLKVKFEKTLREQTEKSMRQQILEEEFQLQSKVDLRAQGEVNKYKALIIQAISEHWIIPTEANKKLTCRLMIRLAPGGTVLDVQIVRMSGDSALDSSARKAVLKASPLPVPKDKSSFAPFREFVLNVKPKDILTSSEDP